MQKVSQSWCLISKNNSALLSTSIGTVLVQNSIFFYLFYLMAPLSFLLLLLSPGHPFYTLQPEWTFKSINHIMSPSTYILQDFLSLEDKSRENLYSSWPIRQGMSWHLSCVSELVTHLSSPHSCHPVPQDLLFLKHTSKPLALFFPLPRITFLQMFPSLASWHPGLHSLAIVLERPP